MLSRIHRFAERYNQLRVGFCHVPVPPNLAGRIMALRCLLHDMAVGVDRGSDLSPSPNEPLKSNDNDG